MFIFIAFFIFFLIYIPPLINFSDGAEFAISFYSLGISHPPSYPLFINLSRILYWVPLGNIYFRLCIFTIIISSLIFYLIWRLYDGNKLQKFILSIFLVSSENFFENTLIGEVYGLNLLFFVTIFFLINRYKSKKYFYLIFFLFGLALGNHHSIVLLMPYFFIELYSNRSNLNLKDFVTGLLFFILGLFVYLYLPIRALKDPLWNWGNPKNFVFFITNILRLDFSNKGLLRPFEHLISQLTTLNPVYDIGLINSIIGVVLLIFLFFRNKKIFVKSLILIFCYSILFVILLGYDEIEPEKMYITYSPFYIPIYFVLAFVVAESSLYIKKSLQIILILLITTGFVVNLKKYLIDFDLTKFSFKTYNYTKSKMSMLPRDSVLILQGGEEDFPIFFEQKICKFRQDITLIPLSMLGKKWNFRESIKAGTTYSKGYEGEFDNKKAIMKAVILFQKEFNNKRVFVSLLQKEELPNSIKLDINGPFYEYEKTSSLNPKFLRTSYLSKKDVLIDEIAKLNMISLKDNKKERDVFLYYSSLRNRINER